MQKENNMERSIRTCWRKHRGFLAWWLISVVYAYQYILRVIPSVTLHHTLERFQVDAAQYGQYSGIYYIGYAGFHLPMGLLIDRYGPKRVVPTGLLLILFGLLPLLYSHVWELAVLGRFLVGVGSSAIILGVFKVIRMEFPLNQFNRMLGLSAMIGLLGAIYGGRPVGHWIQERGVESTLIGILGVGLLLVLGLVLSLRRQEGLSPSAFPQSGVRHSVWGDLKAVLANPRVLEICFLGGLMVGPMEGFADVWGASFLEQAYGFERAVAVGLPSLIFLGFCFGSPFLSWLGDRMKASLPLILSCAASMTLCFFLLLLGWVPAAGVHPLLFFVGICSAYQLFVISESSRRVPERLMGLAAAAANMILMTFGYVFHSLIGKLMSLQWAGELSSEGTPVYSSLAFRWSLSVVPLALVVATIGFTRIVLRKNKG